MRAIVRFNEVSFLVEVSSYHELCIEIAHCLSPILPSLTPEFICLRLLLLLSPDNINIEEKEHNNHTNIEEKEHNNHTTLVGMPVFSEDSFAKISEFSEKHNPHLTPVLGLDTYMSLRLPQQLKHMKLRVHFGPGCFFTHDDNNNDVHFLMHRMVQLVQLALPNLISNPLIPHDNAESLSVLVHVESKQFISHACLYSINDGLSQSNYNDNNNNNNNNTLDSVNSRLGEKELKFQLVLEVYVKSLGKMLIFTQKQWKSMKALLLQEKEQSLLSTTTNTEKNTIIPSSYSTTTDVSLGENHNHNGNNNNNNNNNFIDLEVVLLHYTPHNGSLRVYRYEEFIKGLSHIYPAHSTSVESLTVMDIHGNILGKVRIDIGQPPHRKGLEQTLRKLLFIQQEEEKQKQITTMRMAYRVDNHRELLPLESDTDILQIVCDVQQFGSHNITIVTAIIGGVSSSASVPLLETCTSMNSNGITITSNNTNNDNTINNNSNTITSVIATELRDQTSPLSPPSPSPLLLLAADETAALQQKREETRRTVSKYVQLMRSLRYRVNGLSPQRIRAITPPRIITSTHSRCNSPERKTGKSEDVLFVRYELDPVEVRVAGNITEKELQSLANAIIDRCVYHYSNNNNNNNNNISNTNNSSLHTTSDVENHVKYPNTLSSSYNNNNNNNNICTGDTSDQGLQFKRLQDSMYVLLFPECVTFTDAQITQLEECLVDVVTQFGCRRVPDDQSVQHPLLNSICRTNTNVC